MPAHDDSLFGIHANALRLRARRATLLASNLANADTPNYKARELDFRAALDGAGGAGLGLARTRSGHLSPAGQEPPGAELKYRVPLQPTLDGNTVDSHVEHAAFAENAVQYQASLQFLDARISGLIKALRGE